MKGSKARSLNHATTGEDDCGVPSTSEGVKSDDALCNFLDMKLFHSKHEKVKKLMNKEKKY